MSLYLEDPYYFAKFIATLVVATQVTSVAFLVAMVLLRKQARPILAWAAKHSTLLALIVALTATLSSLTFSDVFDMNPCKLCWYQRIVIFPQVVLLGIALWKKHHDVITNYVIAFACIALPISIFHYMLQMTDAPAVHSFAPCDVTGQAPSCSSFYVLIYGYVTIPMMALTTSAALLLLMINRKVVDQLSDR